MDSLLRDFEPIFKKYIDDQDMSNFMVYLVDIVHPDALIYLAGQFNVLGWRGWDVAEALDLAEIIVDPTQDPYKNRRELIKNAISFSKKVTTPAGIIQALGSIGFGSVQIIEGGFAQFYDGTYYYDGSIYYDGGGNSWAQFDVIVTVPDLGTITQEIEDLVNLMIRKLKPKRSVLRNLTFTT